MTLSEAMFSLRPFRRPHSLDAIQYFLPSTGPYKDLVSCDYFVVYYNNKHEDMEFSTSIDLYPEDIIANDYILEMLK